MQKSMLAVASAVACPAVVVMMMMTWKICCVRRRTGIYFHNQITDPGATDATSTTVDLVARGDVLFEQRPYSTDEQDGMFFKLNLDTEAVTFG